MVQLQSNFKFILQENYAISSKGILFTTLCTQIVQSLLLRSGRYKTIATHLNAACTASGSGPGIKQIIDGTFASIPFNLRIYMKTKNVQWTAAI